MNMAVCDIETDGTDATHIWCASILADDGRKWHFTDPEGMQEVVDEFDKIIGHFFLSFDRPLLEDLWDVVIPRDKVIDTVVMSRLDNPNRDGGHSMEAWGEFLGRPKTEHDDWSHYSEEMKKRCDDDCEVNWAIYRKLTQRLFTEQEMYIEHRVAEIIEHQRKRGWMLDEEACYDLLAELKERKLELEDEVHETFKPVPTLVKEVQPKTKIDGSFSIVGLKFLGDDALEIVAGPLSRIDFPEFNLGSRKQIGERLVRAGWVPQAWTPTGQPIVSETVLENVDIPEAQLIAEYLTVEKRAAMVASWLEAVTPDGRVHGYVNSNGAVTGRMTHSAPNVAQVTAKRKAYGERMRQCWIVPEGFTLVGMDADGLELRMLAHYLNDDEFTRAVVHGKQEDGTDIHSVNMRNAGLRNRDQAKTFIYAFLYGAGDAKIGDIVGGCEQDGKRLKAKFLRNTPSLDALRKRVERASKRGWLKGLDGRRILVRNQYSALNTLLQGAGAVVMKQALIHLWDNLDGCGYEWYPVGNIHDEIQSEVETGYQDQFGLEACNAVTQAGVTLELRCPLSGSYSTGRSWADTH